MIHILYSGLGNYQRQIQSDFSDPLKYSLKEAIEPIIRKEADVFIIGPEQKNPVKVVQRLNANDAQITIFILAEPSQYVKTRQSLQFSPGIGNSAVCVQFRRETNLVELIHSASLRTRQKRSFQKTNEVAKAFKATPQHETAIKSVHLGSFLEQAPVGTILLDPHDNNVVSFNAKAKKVLGKITVFAGLIKGKAYETMDEDSQRYLEKITATATRMAQTLRDLLGFTQLGKEEIFEPVDLTQIIEQVCEDLEMVISQKNATVTVLNLPVLLAGRSQMKQLFYNLVNNALKFSQAGKPPAITISSRHVKAGEVALYPELSPVRTYYHIEIVDNGIGFEQQYAEQIFSVFQRLHSQAAYAGTGIGLALCKKVVMNHSGKISAKSSPGQGSKFIIILPEN
ncbi:sensor histidine kinase [Dyadobacter alkalitolerans]|uniref:sensor histidine kinase n=1 Tax=Dyadobacter alkalitolerans TaxID=492736 RepID=UPI00040FDFF2|nr:ATP-binding protein [Dyadobacter alkalitolerans]